MTQHEDVIHWDCQDAGCRAANGRRKLEAIVAYIEALPVAEFMGLESIMAHQAQVRGLDTNPLETYVPRPVHPREPFSGFGPWETHDVQGWMHEHPDGRVWVHPERSCPVMAPPTPADIRGLTKKDAPRSAHPSGPCGNSDCERCYPLTAVFWKKQAQS